MGAATLLLLLFVVSCALTAHAYRPRFVSKIRTHAKGIDKRPMMNKSQQFLALTRNLPQQFYIKIRNEKRSDMDDEFDEEKRAGRYANRQNTMLAWMRNVPLKRFGSAGLFDPTRYQNAFYEYELPVVPEN